MKVWTDSSLTASCFVIEGYDPVVENYDKKVTVNEGEYLPLMRALFKLFRTGYAARDKLVIHMDSKLVVDHINGAACCRANNLKPLLAEVSYLVQLLKAKVVWIPREQNLAGKVLG